jgi:hypothetical protein
LSIVLSIDYSTSSTGWALFNLKNKELLEYGLIKPKVKGITKMKYPVKQLSVQLNIADRLFELIHLYNPDVIVMEEVNLHKNRLAGKTLDGGHFIFYNKIIDYLDRLVMIDSDGMTGWRTMLGLRLSAADRLHNKEAKKLNKKIAKGTTKIPIINKKHLACRFINREYNTNFNVEVNKTDTDIVDAIGLGHSYLHFPPKQI